MEIYHTLDHRPTDAELLEILRNAEPEKIFSIGPGGTIIEHAERRKVSKKVAPALGETATVGARL